MMFLASCAGRTLAVAGLLSAALAPAGLHAQGSSLGESYQPVDANDFVGGYVPEGTRAEVSGFLGAKDGVVMFKYHPISAQYPWTVVTSNLPRELLERVGVECAWDGVTIGMCKAVVRGTVMSKASRSIVADDIVIE
jgi:hypothetical protein